LPYKGAIPICAPRRCFHFVQATIFATFAAPQEAFVLLATLKKIFILFDAQLVQCDIVFVLFFYILLIVASFNHIVLILSPLLYTCIMFLLSLEYFLGIDNI